MWEGYLVSLRSLLNVLTVQYKAPHIFFLLQTPLSMSDERSLALSSWRSVLGLLSSCSLVSPRMCFQGSPQCTLVLAPLCATHHLLFMKLPSCIVSSDMCLYCISKSHVSVLSNFVILSCGSSDKNLVKCTTKSVYRFKAVHIKAWTSDSPLLFVWGISTDILKQN